MSDSLRDRIAAALKTANDRVAGFIGYDDMADAVIRELEPELNRHNTGLAIAAIVDSGGPTMTDSLRDRIAAALESDAYRQSEWWDELPDFQLLADAVISKLFR